MFSFLKPPSILSRIAEDSNDEEASGEEITEEVVNELENAVKVLSNQFNQLQQQTNEHKVRFLIVFS